MMFCSNCGAQIEDGSAFCGSCGTRVEGGQAAAQQPYTATAPGAQPYAPPGQPSYGAPPQQPYMAGAAQSGGEHKMSVRTASLLCYWFSFIGWLISYYMADNRDTYLRFHLNQSLVLWIGFIITGALAQIRALSGLAGLLDLALFVLWLIAFIGACKGQTKSAPLLDKIRILT